MTGSITSMIRSSDAELGCDKNKSDLPVDQTDWNKHEKISKGQTLSCCRRRANDKPILFVLTA
jgi:hypothetical protein